MKYERFTWKTEKLQHSDDEVIIVVDNANKDWNGHILNVVDLLNQLHQENEHLIIGNKNLMKKNEQLKRQNIQSKREESLNLKDYVETDERGHIVKVKLVDYIDDLIYERLNKKLEG